MCALFKFLMSQLYNKLYNLMLLSSYTLNFWCTIEYYMILKCYNLIILSVAQNQCFYFFKNPPRGKEGELSIIKELQKKININDIWGNSPHPDTKWRKITSQSSKFMSYFVTLSTSTTENWFPEVCRGLLDVIKDMAKTWAGKIFTI